MAGLSPMKTVCLRLADLRAVGLGALDASRSALRTTLRSVSMSSGLVRKSYAPARIASTAVGIVP
jgi:hypothetical protein